MFTFLRSAINPLPALTGGEVRRHEADSLLPRPDMVPLAGEQPRLVHLTSTVVGSSNPSLLRDLY